MEKDKEKTKYQKKIHFLFLNGVCKFLNSVKKVNRFISSFKKVYFYFYIYVPIVTSNYKLHI